MNLNWFGWLWVIGGFVVGAVTIWLSPLFGLVCFAFAAVPLMVQHSGPGGSYNGKQAKYGEGGLTPAQVAGEAYQVNFGGKVFWTVDGVNPCWPEDEPDFVEPPAFSGDINSPVDVAKYVVGLDNAGYVESAKKFARANRETLRKGSQGNG